MKVDKYIIKACDLDIKGITLLSKEEYEENREKIRRMKYDRCCWWLRSRGCSKEFVDYVNEFYGSVHDDAFVYRGRYGVDDWHFVVRPALILKNLNSSDFKIGNRFRLFDFNWTIISNGYALCDTAIGAVPFRRDVEAKDANVYEASDMKKFLEEWWDKQVKDHLFEDVMYIVNRCICLACKTELPQGAQFCFKCGTKVE